MYIFKHTKANLPAHACGLSRKLSFHILFLMALRAIFLLLNVLTSQFAWARFLFLNLLSDAWAAFSILLCTFSGFFHKGLKISGLVSLLFDFFFPLVDSLQIFLLLTDLLKLLILNELKTNNSEMIRKVEKLVPFSGI